MEKEKLEAAAKKALDERASQLTGGVKSALSQARYSAINSVGSRRQAKSSWVWGGAAMAASMVLMVLIWQPRSSLPAAEMFALDDMELMLSEDGFELYEDLDFIAWLDEVEVAG